MTSINVLLADDHTVILDSLAMMISTLDGIRVVGKATNGREALEKIATLDVDIVLSDMHMPEMNGIELAWQLSEQYPEVRLILLTMEEEPDVVQAAELAGVWGYVLKRASVQELENAIRAVTGGEKYYMEISDGEARPSDSTNLSDPPETKSNIGQLSKREIQIIRMIVNDVPGPEIAKQLFISPTTVDTHRRNIFRKLNIHTAVALTRIALENKLV
ncbi:MAG: response regulator transcription factor [Bacteroidetes bacterium]|nr:response regulator transcription factor [Bacteroidota bacterium]